MSKKSSQSKHKTTKKLVSTILGVIVLGGGLIAGVTLVLQPEIFNKRAETLTYLCKSGDCESYCAELNGVCSGKVPNCNCLIKATSSCKLGTVKCTWDRTGLATCVGQKTWSISNCLNGCANKKCMECEPDTSWCSGDYNFSCDSYGRIKSEYGTYCPNGCSTSTGKCI